jgi:RNA polymerase sigma-70 factor (ECF subfamily)
LPDERASTDNPERDAQLADSVGLALLIVLDRLAPAERIAFVLHDMFDVSFDEIASIVHRSPDAARQLASRARRRVQGADPPAGPELTRRRKVVDAFLAALRRGDVPGLLAVLDPDVAVHIDEAAARPGAAREIRGAATFAKGAVTFSQLAHAVEPMLVDGSMGLVWAPGGKLARVLKLVVVHERIVDVEIIADAERLAAMDLSVLGS